jgi:hypothetical protein
MPCYDLNGNAVPGTPQTCASLGGVWRDGVPQSLQQPEETVVAPGMNYHGKPIEGKFKYPNLFEDGGGTAVNTNKPQSAYSTTDINNSLKGINQFFHSAIDKEFDGGFMGFNPVNNIAHNSISKHMSSYNNPNQVTPSMIANTREMIRDKAGSRLGPQKTQYILDRFNRYAKKVEDYQKASGNIPVTSPTSKRPYDITDANMGYTTKTQLPSKVQEQSVDSDKLNTVVEWIKNNPVEAASYGLMAGSGAGPIITTAAGAYKLAKNSKHLKKAYDWILKKDAPRISKGTGKTPLGEKLPILENKVIKLPNGKTKTILRPKKDSKGDVIYQTEKVLDKGKVAGIAGAGLYGASQVDMGDGSPSYAGQKNSMGFPDPATGVVPKPIVDYTTAGGTGGTGTAKKSSIKWDEMAKLGQLMAHYGTPLSKRKEHPSKQWGTELAAAQTAAAKAAAAGNKTIFSKAGNKQHERALREKVAIKMGKGEWLDVDPTEEELDAQVAESAIAINYLIANMKMSPAAAEELVLNSIK